MSGRRPEETSGLSAVDRIPFDPPQDFVNTLQASEPDNHIVGKIDLERADSLNTDMAPPVMYVAANRDFTDWIEWLVLRKGFRFALHSKEFGDDSKEWKVTEAAFRGAANAGATKTLDWLMRRTRIDLKAAGWWWKGFPPHSIGIALMCDAAEANKRNVIEWATDRGVPRDGVVAERAAVFGHVDLVEWLAENGFPLSEEIAEAAAARGHSHVEARVRKLLRGGHSKKTSLSGLHMGKGAAGSSAELSGRSAATSEASGGEGAGASWGGKGKWRGTGRVDDQIVPVPAWKRGKGLGKKGKAGVHEKEERLPRGESGRRHQSVASRSLVEDEEEDEASEETQKQEEKARGYSREKKKTNPPTRERAGRGKTRERASPRLLLLPELSSSSAGVESVRARAAGAAAAPTASALGVTPESRRDKKRVKGSLSSSRVGGRRGKGMGVSSPPGLSRFSSRLRGRRHEEEEEDVIVEDEDESEEEEEEDDCGEERDVSSEEMEDTEELQHTGRRTSLGGKRSERERERRDTAPKQPVRGDRSSAKFRKQQQQQQQDDALQSKKKETARQRRQQQEDSLSPSLSSTSSLNHSLNLRPSTRAAVAASHKADRKGGAKVASPDGREKEERKGTRSCRKEWVKSFSAAAAQSSTAQDPPPQSVSLSQKKKELQQSRLLSGRMISTRQHPRGQWSPASSSPLSSPPSLTLPGLTGGPFGMHATVESIDMSQTQSPVGLETLGSFDLNMATPGSGHHGRRSSTRTAARTPAEKGSAAFRDCPFMHVRSRDSPPPPRRIEREEEEEEEEERPPSSLSKVIGVKRGSSSSGDSMGRKFSSSSLLAGSSAEQRGGGGGGEDDGGVGVGSGGGSRRTKRICREGEVGRGGGKGRGRDARDGGSLTHR